MKRSTSFRSGNLGHAGLEGRFRPINICYGVLEVDFFGTLRSAFERFFERLLVGMVGFVVFFRSSQSRKRLGKKIMLEVRPIAYLSTWFFLSG